MRNTILTLFLVVVAIVAVRAGDITANGIWQGDLFTFLSNVVTMSNELKTNANYLQTAMNLSKSNLTANGVTTDIGTVTFMIDGVVYYKASATAALTAAAQTKDTHCRYLVSMNSGGTATATKGTEVTDTTSVIGAVTTVTPEPPSGYCPLGYILVVASDAFTLGTTSFNASCSFVDLSFIPTTAEVTTTDLTLTDL